MLWAGTLPWSFADSSGQHGRHCQQSCGSVAHSLRDSGTLSLRTLGACDSLGKNLTFQKTFYHPSPILVWCSSLTLLCKDAVKAWWPICKYFSINTDWMKMLSGGVMTSEVLCVHPATAFWLHSVLSCFCRSKTNSWSKVNRFTCNLKMFQYAILDLM